VVARPGGPASGLGWRRAKMEPQMNADKKAGLPPMSHASAWHTWFLKNNRSAFRRLQEYLNFACGHERSKCIYLRSSAFICGSNIF
jgi:hypothetical protein